MPTGKRKKDLDAISFLDGATASLPNAGTILVSGMIQRGLNELHRADCQIEHDDSVQVTFELVDPVLQLREILEAHLRRGVAGIRGLGDFIIKGDRRWWNRNSQT